MTDVLFAVVRDVGGWLSSHRSDVLLVTAALAVAATTVLVYRASRRDRLADIATWAAVVIATAFSAEGMWEVAREGLGLSMWQAAGLFAAAEAAMTSEAIRARRRHQAGQHPGAHGTAVWVIAGSAGLVAALNADSGVEVPVRLGMPLLAAALWWLELTSDGAGRKPTDAISWRLTPRRILVRVGLAEPGERDVIEVDRARRVAALTTTAHRLHHGWPPLRRLHTARLRRLALAADEAMVAEARVRVDRVHRIVALTSPTPDGERTGPDVTDVSVPDTGAQVDPDVDSSDDPDVSAVSARTSTRTGRRTSGPSERTSRGADTAVAVTQLRAAHPHMTAGEIARRIGVTDRTVRRHLPKAQDQEPDPATVPAGRNGHADPSHAERGEHG